MDHFLLVRHSISAVDFSVPAATWGLSTAGRAACEPLAARMAAHKPTLIVTSHEPKAMQTGQIVGKRLGVRVKTADNLHEHDRSNVRDMPNDQFKASVARLFMEPDALFFGTETGNQAKVRFETAVFAILTQHPHEKIAIVAHGTVITLFLAAHNPIDPIAFWQALKMPDLLVVDKATMRLDNHPIF